MTDPTPRQVADTHIADGYANSVDVAQLRSRAANYRPEDDAEIERLKALPDEHITPTMRTAIGYHESAREAAAELATIKEN